jgi:hypothetical protein
MDIARDNVKDMTRLASNNARAAEEITKGVTRASNSGSSFGGSTATRTGSTEDREEGRQRR